MREGEVMTQETRWLVWGGRFADTASAMAATIIVDGWEMHGPFATEAEANKVCLDRMRRNVDTCAHRMFVTPLTGLDYANFASGTLHGMLLTIGVKALVAFGKDSLGVEVVAGDPALVPAQWAGLAVHLENRHDTPLAGHPDFDTQAFFNDQT